MTTREELIDGLRTVVREGLRVMSGFGPNDWKRPALGDEAGWDRRQVYCHLAAVAEIAPGFLGNLGNAEEGQDALGGLDIDALNAQLVAGKEQLSEQDLMEAFKTSFERLIELIPTVPDEQLRNPTKFGLLEGPAIEIMDSVLVLHSIAHIYGAGGSPLG